MDLKQIILRKGTQAKTVLDDEIFKEALQSVREGYLDEWENTKIKDSEVREKAYMAVRLLKEIEGRLQAFVSSALFEQNQ